MRSIYTFAHQAQVCGANIVLITKLSISAALSTLSCILEIVTDCDWRVRSGMVDILIGALFSVLLDLGAVLGIKACREARLREHQKKRR
jgi:hypothetical protein